MDTVNDFDYVLTMVCVLTRFCQFIPCQKTITSEKVFKRMVKHRIFLYGKPTTIISDNDVRLTQDQCFYRNAFDAMDIQTIFTTPYRPQSNGLCERANRSFIQNLRVISHQQTKFSSHDWISLTPFVTLLINSQVCTKTGYTPQELFLGRPPTSF